MKRLLIPSLSLLAILATGATGAAEAPDDGATHGAALLLPFKQQLKAALESGMAEGPAAAIGVCRDEAPAIAASLSTNGVTMGRTSHRLRNPENRPPAWAAPLLDRYAAGEASGGATVALDGGLTGYVEPITVQPVCMACHGTTLAPGVAGALTRLYPDDAATGFAAGDFRGLFWVTYPTP
jgi:hypothetical protein